MLTGSRLFETGLGSDLTITCKGIIFKVQLVCNASLYSMGEKYGINGLKGIASEKSAVVFKQREWSVPWNSPNISIGALGTAIKRIYDTTPESDKGLRDQVLGYAKLHLKGLLTREDF